MSQNKGVGSGFGRGFGRLAPSIINIIVVNVMRRDYDISFAQSK